MYALRFPEAFSFDLRDNLDLAAAAAVNVGRRKRRGHNVFFS